MTPFSLTPPQKTTIVFDIVQQMLDQIQNGALQAGDRLPTERQLMEMLNVSRASVREALQTLTGMGIIEARVGDGTFIKTLKPHLALELELQKIARDAQRQDRIYLLEARTVVEKGIIELAITNASSTQQQELQQVTQQWLAACTPDDVQLALHDQIHMTMAHMTGNPLLARVLQTLLEALPAAVRNYGLMGDPGEGDGGGGDYDALQHELSIHTRLTAAIIDGDLAQALLVFDEHQAQEADLIRQYYAAQ